MHWGLLTLKGPCNTLLSNLWMTSPKEFIVSWIAHSRKFLNPDISEVTVSSLRGVPLSEHVHAPFVLMNALEATQRGVRKGQEATTVYAMTLSISSSFFSLSIFTLPQQRHACHQSRCGNMAAPHGNRGNCVHESANGSSFISYTVHTCLLMWFNERTAGAFQLHFITKVQTPWCVTSY